MYLHQMHKEVVVFHFISDHDLGELTVVLGWNFAGRIGLQLYNTVQILLFYIYATFAKHKSEYSTF